MVIDEPFRPHGESFTSRQLDELLLGIPDKNTLDKALISKQLVRDRIERYDWFIEHNLTQIPGSHDDHLSSMTAVEIA